MNMMAFDYDGHLVIVDCGVMFPDAELLGVDIVIPDITFLRENQDRLKAILLTHGHEDHIGALPYILDEVDAPVYGSPFTLALARAKLADHGLADVADLREMSPGEPFQVGPFNVEFIHLTHSIIDAGALALRTPVGTLIHTGDFKFDPTPMDQHVSDLHRLAEYGREGVLALFSDSTNIDRPGMTPSERAVRERFEEIMAEAKGRVLISCFATSLHRMQLFVNLAQEYRRRNEVAVMLTGSQGEPMAALSRVAVNNHKWVTAEPGDDVVISARVIPGNEKSIFRMIDHLYRRGARIHYQDGSQPPVHVSGHGSAEELKLMLNLIRPQYFVPIHGEYRQLYRHTVTANELGAVSKEVFLLESGDVLEFDAQGARRVGRVPVGRVCIDVGTLDEVGDVILKERRLISEDGIVIPILAINEHTGELEAQPQIVSRGFVPLDEAHELVESAREVILKTVAKSNLEEVGDWGVIKEKIRTALRKHFDQETGKRPMILPVILEV
jgi:ribonuclease J